MSELHWKNIKTIYTYKSSASDYGYELRIGRWVVDGRDRDIVLAKQEFKILGNDQIQWGKIKGLIAGDMYRIFGMARVIAEAMEFPLPGDFPKQMELAERDVA